MGFGETETSCISAKENRKSAKRSMKLGCLRGQEHGNFRAPGADAAGPVFIGLDLELWQI